MPKYHKLVRDRIPEIIESTGKSCKTEILSDTDYLKMVDAKLDEELAEYHRDQNIEELADLLEVIRAAAVARGYTLEELERVRAKKEAERGAFKEKILLTEVLDTAMNDLMARTMVENLAMGINPLTGEALPKGNICNNEVVQTALETVLEYCTLDSYATALHKKMHKKEKKTYVVKEKDTVSGKTAFRPVTKGHTAPQTNYDEMIKSLCEKAQKKNREHKG